MGIIQQVTCYPLEGEQMNHGKRLERIAKAQAKALIGTLTLLDDEGLGDSDLSALRGSLRSWIEHITPIRESKWDRKVHDDTDCEVEK
jgi:hypothetical protein